jgi:hypothetical protein
MVRTQKTGRTTFFASRLVGPIRFQLCARCLLLIATALFVTQSPAESVSIQYTELFSGKTLASPGSVDLSADAPRDWAHWGATAVTDFNHKSTNNIVPVPVGLISNVTAQGNGLTFGQTWATYKWNDGAPTPAAMPTNGLRVFPVDDAANYKFTIPADFLSLNGTVQIYAGVFSTAGMGNISTTTLKVNVKHDNLITTQASKSGPLASGFTLPDFMPQTEYKYGRFDVSYSADPLSATLDFELSSIMGRPANFAAFDAVVFKVVPEPSALAMFFVVMLLPVRVGRR